MSAESLNSYFQKIEEHLVQVQNVINKIPTLNLDTLYRLEKDMEALRLEAKYCKADDLPGIMDQMNNLHNLIVKFSRPLKLPDGASPFFGHMRIFQDKKEKDIYLGHVSLMHEQMKFKIIDWKRAPLAKVFYQYDEGDDFDFDVEDRTVEGQILEKSVITIVNGKLYRIDRNDETYVKKEGKWTSSNEEKVHLSGGQGQSYGEIAIGTGNTDHKNPDVISMLDKEQFKIVEADAKAPLLIVGGAGSGKTTVALYRMARLLENKAFGESEAVIIVPNLGLIRLAETLLEKMGLYSVKVRALDEVFSTLVRQAVKGVPTKVYEEAPLVSGIIKRHHSTLQILSRYVQKIERDLIHDLKKIDLDLTFQRMKGPVGRRLEELSFRADGIKAIKLKEMRQNLNNILELYFNFLSSSVFQAQIVEASGDVINQRMMSEFSHHFNRQINSFDSDKEYLEREIEGVQKSHGHLDMDDYPLLLELRRQVWGSFLSDRSGAQKQYKHIFLDEAQELSPVQLGIVGGLIHKEGNITVAGDAVQQIDPTISFDSWDKVLDHLGVENVGVTELNVSYRSPKEVVEFSHQVLGPLSTGELPKTKKTSGPVVKTQIQHLGHATVVIGKALEDLVKREPKATVAIICNKLDAARTIADDLGDLPNVRLVENADFKFTPGIDVTSVDQIRGLEFDYVIIPDCDRVNYPENARARKRLHLAATRAMHQLWVLYPSERTLLF